MMINGFTWAMCTVRKYAALMNFQMCLARQQSQNTSTCAPSYIVLLKGKTLLECKLSNLPMEKNQLIFLLATSGTLRTYPINIVGNFGKNPGKIRVGASNAKRHDPDHIGFAPLNL